MSMHCTQCGEKLDSDARFCVQCGKPVVNTAPSSSTAPRIISVEKTVPSGGTSRCQLCGRHAPTKYNEFYANIGMLVMRRQKHIKAEMCRACTDSYFWKFTTTNLLLGWWGLISFFATCFFMINNVTRYLGTLGLKRNY